MPHILAYNLELHILEVIIRGDYLLAESKQLLLETVEMVKEHNCLLILTDLRDANIKLSTHDRYDAPEYFKSAFAASDFLIGKIKRAVVVAKEAQDDRFLENVLVNRGQIMRLFQDVGEAKEWLIK